MDDRIDLPHSWYGWRLAGRHLISPAGERITQERLSGLLWRDQAELRLAGYASRRLAEANRRRQASGPKIKVVIVEMTELRKNGQLAS